MKKWIALMLVLAMAMLAGCAGTPVVGPEDTKAPTGTTNPVETTTEPVIDSTTGATQEGGDTLKTGLAVVSTVGASKSAGEKNGAAQSDITMVAVLVDENGVIVDCVIDSIQAKAEFDGAGKILSDLTAPVATKNELGESYGMKQYSGIGKEWNEQAEALAQYVIGKTVEEVKGISLNEQKKATDADLSASVTVSIGGYLDAIALAVENAQELGAQKGDTLKLTAVTKLSGSDAGEKEGKIQADATVSALSFRGDAISSCVIDAVQCTVKFDTKGAITSDISAPVQSKNQLGENYGMKQYSGIGKEWNEQAAAFASYVTGKTLAEVSGIALTEKGNAAEADLASSVTINLYGFLDLIKKAAN